MTKPFFKPYGITLYADDCVHGMREILADRSVSIVVTSPPYNIGAKYNAYHDRLPRDGYLDWMVPSS